MQAARGWAVGTQGDGEVPWTGDNQSRLRKQGDEGGKKELMLQA